MPSHGKTGPEAHHVAYGTNVEQLSGLASLSGYPGMGPHKSPIAYGDPNAGAIAAAAALAALLHREQTGEGQHVEVAQWEAMVGNIGEFVLGWQMALRDDPQADIEAWSEAQRIGNRHRSRVQGVYSCARPRTPTAMRGWRSAWGRMRSSRRCVGSSGGPSWCGTSGTWTWSRGGGTTTSWTRSSGRGRGSGSQDEAARTLQAAGVSAAPVLKLQRLLEDEHLRARGFWETVSHPAAGEWDMEGPVWRMSRTPGHVRLPAPRFGEHNGWVLGELLGLSEAEIAELEASGVTAREPNAGVHS